MKVNLMKITIHELLKFGVHVGYHKQYLNSQIKPYLVGFRGQFNIFNLKPVKYQLQVLLQAITKLATQRQTFLIINHYKESLSIRQIFSLKRCFVLEGFWLGGFLTNFKTIRLYTKYLTNQKDSYLSKFRSLPSFLIFINTTTDNWGVREGLNLNIPLAVATGSNYNLLNKTIYPLVGSNETTEAQRFYSTLIKQAIIRGFHREKFQVIPMVTKNLTTPKN